MVMESDNMDEEAVQAIKDAGIPVIGDRREGYMHDKFTVIDRLEVWGGSMNYTSNDAYRNNNNLIRIRSSVLAEDYTTEFNEMFDEDLFGPDDRAATPHPSLTVNGTPIEVYFSPDDGVAAHIVSLIQGAQQSIYFLAYSFTSDDISEAMLVCAQAGVTVAGVFEESQVKSNTGDEYDKLRTAGLDVRLDGNRRNMHDKIILIDRQTVITGSYNFSANAEKKNDENVMVIHSTDIAALYMQEFEKVFALGQK
jgi:phosphatidylserine/phosphatidylglycerophosphate/cardiolipin synthase-like enzyme